MLIHGRLVVTGSGCMLDEVKSLLQKSLRRQEHDLTFQATKELISGPTDQLKWKNIVTFMFEDHCLNHVELFEQLYKLYQRNKKYDAIELMSKCYTCRMAACLQVVALNDEHRQYEKFWETDMTAFSDIEGILSTKKTGINVDQLLANIVRKWQTQDKDALISLFGLVNMAAKIDDNTVAKAGMAVLIDKDMKKPSLHNLVLSILYRNTEDEYLKRIIMICFHFCSIPDTPQGLILFTVLTQLMYKSKVLSAPIPDAAVGNVNWEEVPKLAVMPSWAVDKHTYRGKFGKSSEHLFLKKFKPMGLSEQNLKEFHGERPKTDIRAFFDVGCVCYNDILASNPYWEDAKSMYLKQKPSMQKCAKMTKMYYNKLLEDKSICCTFVSGKANGGNAGEEQGNKKRKAKSDSLEMPRRKILKTDKTAIDISIAAQASSCSRTLPKGPLLQLPTGSGKVYTRLDMSTMKVFKGPYRSKERQNLCIFLHRAMREVFNDKHTMEITEDGQYLVFPILKSEGNEIKIAKREFYDCIAKQLIPEDEGQFIDRDTLGIVQLHKLRVTDLSKLPVSVWINFMFRYVLNVGDTGLYNAIATNDLRQIFGIDMEERRTQVKGNDVINMMFGKLPKKEFCKEILRIIHHNEDKLLERLTTDFDFEKLGELFRKYKLSDESALCKDRLENIKNAVSHKKSGK